MSDELRAARQRVRRIYGGESYVEVYSREQTGGGLLQIDEERLIEAYLAEHRDDDGELPVTEEWLREIGWLQDGEHEIPAKLARRIWDIHEYESNGTDPAMQLLWDSSDNSMWIETYGAGGESLCLTEIPAPQTRGQLRNLLTALNITATERGTSENA